MHKAMRPAMRCCAGLHKRSTMPSARKISSRGWAAMNSPCSAWSVTAGSWRSSSSGFAGRSTVPAYRRRSARQHATPISACRTPCAKPTAACIRINAPGARGLHGQRPTPPAAAGITSLRLIDKPPGDNAPHSLRHSWIFSVFAQPCCLLSIADYIDSIWRGDCP